MIVIVAEKPSVGRDIAHVLGCSQSGEGCIRGDKYTVTWALGHLVTLCEPDEIDEKYKKWRMDDLPMLPDELPTKIIAKTRKQFTVVKKLINDKDTERVICATDAGREGELIFYYIYTQAKCQKPVDRLWISSMTDEAIREGFDQLKPDVEYEGLRKSAVCRALLAADMLRQFDKPGRHDRTRRRIALLARCAIVPIRYAVIGHVRVVYREVG